MYTNPSHPDDISSENGIYHRPIPNEGTVKAWDCDDLPAFIDLLFNYSIIIEDDLKDKCDNLIHRDSIKSKQEFDEMLHSLWPAEGVDKLLSPV
ncbi:hypothetical protein C2G38_2170088 [Gigaspora rosea]|uniref:Uncharacterized protein n=1 Tax=Gigaspora rosea TaxID=44941 RepID=A0A397VMW9_9GLOM|nr:hypothetical protein C2G38_2170088 [Gigaspora rosea]